MVAQPGSGSAGEDGGGPRIDLAIELLTSSEGTSIHAAARGKIGPGCGCWGASPQRGGQRSSSVAGSTTCGLARRSACTRSAVTPRPSWE